MITTISELKKLARYYLNIKKTQLHSFNIGHNLQFYIIAEVSPIDIGLSIWRKGCEKMHNEYCIGETYLDKHNKFIGILKEYNLTIDDLRFIIEEQILKEL
ncbi:MAG: hypothetical protein H8D97_01490 [Proteobacteria bacterium]|nr:hypothetical protein [Pseudomonadota bacterium]